MADDSFRILSIKKKNVHPCHGGGNPHYQLKIH